MSRRSSNAKKVREKRLKALLAQAKALIKKKDWYQARRVLDRAKAYAWGKSQKSQVQEILRQVDAEGQRQLKLCRQAYSKKKYLEAIEGYKKITATFGNLSSGVAARKLRRQAEANPKVKRLIKEGKANKLSAVIDGIIGNKKANPGTKQPSASKARQKKHSRVEQIKPLPVEKQARAVEFLRKIVKLYPDTKAGKQAASDLESLRADKNFQDTVDRYLLDTQVKALYNTAEIFRKAGLHAKALTYYEKLLKEYPNSEYAAKAQSMVTKIKGKVSG